MSHRRPEWGEQWDAQAMDYLMELGPIKFFRNALQKYANGKCLIVGCRSEVELVGEFSNNITGVNISLRELLSLKRSGIDLVLGDAERLPFKGNCFNSIICKSTLHHLTNTKRALQEFKRTLVHGGYIILYEPGLLNPVALFARKFFPTSIHVSSEKPFDPTVLRELLTRFFTVIEETYFFLLVHIFPILGKYIRLFRRRKILQIINIIDSLLCKLVFKRLSWIITYVLLKG